MNKKTAAAGVGLSVGAAFALPAAAQASLDVDNTTDSGALSTCAAPANDCSLRGAITTANSSPGPDNITFAAGVTGSITLGGTQLPTITAATFIYGPGADVLAIDGNHLSRIFNIDEGTAGDRVVINDLTLRNGTVAADGGAIVNVDSDLTIIDSVLTGNTASGPGGDGGAVFDSGGSPSNGYNDLFIESTFSNNTAGDSGGAVYGFDYVGGIYSSTFTGNTSATKGGAVYAFTPYNTFENDTVAGNAAADGGGIHIHTSGGPAPMMFSTIVAGNSAPLGPDLSLPPAGTLKASFSLIQDTSGATVTSTGPNIFGVGPQLGPLQMNGGPTPTMKPAGLSPVVDKGNTAITHDQRGFPRPFDVSTVVNAVGGNGADIGAVELQSGDGPFTVPAPVHKKKKCKKKKKKKHASVAKKKKCKKKKRKK
jgi:hypothetical protein